MRVWPKASKAKKISLSILLLLFLAALWLARITIFDKPSSASLARILVLDDSDSDFRTPPFEDSVYAFPDGKRIPRVSDLNTAQTVGACRRLSASGNDQFFLVCEDVAHHLTAYQTQTGERLWHLDGYFQSAFVSRRGLVYALTSAGTIYGDKAVVINALGAIERKGEVSGFDLVVDEDRQVLWTVGANIKKCDLALNILWEQKIIGWCAVSVDLNSDGSVWVAERSHPNVPNSQDRLLKISPSGEVLKTLKLDFSPLCLRVNHVDGTLWVTGGGARNSKTHDLLQWIEKRGRRLPLPQPMRDFLERSHAWSKTEKRDDRGNILQKLNWGGFSLAIDEADNSVWIAGRKKLRHYSREGANRGHLGGLSDSQNYVICLPAAAKARTNSSPPANH